MEIADGLIQGVGSGIVLTLALGLWQLCKKYFKRCRQIKEVRERVLMHFTFAMWPVVRMKVTGLPESTITDGILRYSDMQRLHRDLQVVMDHDSDALTAKQRSDMKRRLIDLENLLTLYTSAGEVSVDLITAKTNYTEFLKMKWLNLPQDLLDNRDAAFQKHDGFLKGLLSRLCT